MFYSTFSLIFWSLTHFYKVSFDDLCFFKETPVFTK
jgi:hypothetical protein